MTATADRVATGVDQALVARAGALLQANGESTAVTLAAVGRLNHAFGTDFGLVPGWASLTVLDGGRHPFSLVAPPAGVAMGAVTTAMRAIDAVSPTAAGRAALAAELDRATAARPAPLWLFVLACATGPAALSVIFGVHDATAVLLVALSGATGGLVRRCLARLGIGPVGQVFAAAFLAGAVGGIAVDTDLSTSLRLIAVCPAMILVPGPHILNGVLDLFALRVTLGFARLGYAAVLLLSVGSGLALALALAGTDLPVQPSGRPVSLWLDVVAAGVAAASYAVYFAMPARLIVLPVVVGALAHGVRTWAMDDLGVHVSLGAGIACLVVGAVMAPVAHRVRIPYAAVAFAAVVSLVPGVYVFRMLDALAGLSFGGSESDLLGAVSDGSTAALVVLAMATGLAVPKHLYGQWVSRREGSA